MTEQEVQQQPTATDSNPVQEAREGDVPKEGQIPPESPQIDPELTRQADNWKNLEVFCRNHPQAEKQINEIINDFMSGNPKKEEPKKEEIKKEELKGENLTPQFEVFEKRLREVEEKTINAEIDLSLKRLAARPEYGPEVLAKQKEIEKKVLDLGLVSAIKEGSLNIERAFELAWKDINYANQLTRGKNEVISEIEEKRGVQGPSLQRSNVTQMVAPKPKTFKEALLQAEKDLGYTIEEAKEALYRR